MGHDWKQQLRNRLWASISRLNMSNEQKASLLDSEWTQAVADTEAGRPLGGARAKAEVDEIMAKSRQARINRILDMLADAPERIRHAVADELEGFK